MQYHPSPRANGQKIVLTHPDKPTRLDTWHNPDEVAVVVPQGNLPKTVCEVEIASWAQAPDTTEAWQALADCHYVEAPAFDCPAGLKAAAGVVTRESDGRCWLVAPSNGFGGYKTTFPKGTQEPGLSLQACAIKEAFEESGLQVELTGFLMDVTRSGSYTRYYTARRVGGNPADMGWESQAVLLVPGAKLGGYLINPYDQPLLQALSTKPVATNTI